MTRITLSLLLAAIYSVPAAAAAPERHEITMFKGEARVLDEPNVRRVAVGDGRVVSANVIEGRQMLVLAEEEGQSSMHLWKRDSEVDYSITVVSADAGRLLTEVRALVGEGGNIQTRIVGDKIVLEGNDVSREQARRIEEVSKRYPQVVNLVSLVGLEQMIVVDVSILEFRKTALTDLGIRWNTRDINGPNYGIVGDIHRSAPLGPGGIAAGRVPTVPSGPAVSPFASYFGLTTYITSTISAAVANGDATFLSQPRLTCKSGSSARFLAGGEIPIPLANGFGNVTVQYKQYGVKLEVSPAVSDSGVISTSVLTELSALDSQTVVQGIPGLITRRTETDVNLHEGQSLVISGMFDGSSTKGLEKVPGIGDIPVLGELFKSRNYRRNKTELVIFLTPRVVRTGGPIDQAQLEQANQEAAQAMQELNPPPKKSKNGGSK